MNIKDNPILSIIKSFDDIYLIGLGGSRAKKENDALSDIDYAVISSNSIPARSQREFCFKSLDNLQIKYLDIDFEVSKGDGLIFQDKHFDILWMSHSAVVNFLTELDCNVGCDEFLPGGILKSIPLPDYEKSYNSIIQLIKYSNSRAIKRIELFFTKAYTKLYTLKWLDKAIARSDYYSFNKYSQELIDDIVTILFALNCEWYCDEKRLLKRLESFIIVPVDIASKLKDIIMRSNGNTEMAHCTIQLKKIFAETSQLAKIKYKHIDIPNTWN